MLLPVCGKLPEDAAGAELPDADDAEAGLALLPLAVELFTDPEPDPAGAAELAELLAADEPDEPVLAEAAGVAVALVALLAEADDLVAEALELALVALLEFVAEAEELAAELELLLVVVLELLWLADELFAAEAALSETTDFAAISLAVFSETGVELFTVLLPSSPTTAVVVVALSPLTLISIVTLIF